MDKNKNPSLKMEGPSFTIQFSCHDCTYCKSEYYCVEDGNDCDSGFENYCLHKNVDQGKPKYIGLDWRTPKWCPLMLSRLKNARREIDAKIEQRRKDEENCVG